VCIWFCRLCWQQVIWWIPSYHSCSHCYLDDLVLGVIPILLSNTTLGPLQKANFSCLMTSKPKKKEHTWPIELQTLFMQDLVNNDWVNFQVQAINLWHFIDEVALMNQFQFILCNEIYAKPTPYHARSFNFRLSHFVSCLMWQ
jgi:hypothetical protein